MQYPCPNCSGEFVAEESDVVNGVICPHCNEQVSVAAVPAVPTVAAVPPLIPKREAGQELMELAGEQSVDVVAKVLGDLRKYCTESETVLGLAVQLRVLSGIKPDVIAATDRRLIILRRKILGMDMWDSLWIDIAGVRISESLVGANIFVSCVNGSTATIERLHKAAAQKLYRFCQSGEERMRAARYALHLQSASAAASQVNVNIQQ